MDIGCLLASSLVNVACVRGRRGREATLNVDICCQFIIITWRYLFLKYRQRHETPNVASPPDVSHVSQN